MKECKNCDAELKKGRSKFCSSKCNINYNRRLKYNGGQDFASKTIISKCINCGGEYIKTRRDKLSCSSSCSTSFTNGYKNHLNMYPSTTREEYIEIRKEKLIYPSRNNTELRETIRKFFLRCQSKRWIVDREDLVYILNVYSDIFDQPQEMVGKLEDNYIKMVLAIKNKLKL
jgi:hypothetical protein